MLISRGLFDGLAHRINHPEQRRAMDLQSAYLLLYRYHISVTSPSAPPLWSDIKHTVPLAY